jgi:hypothetical protein
VLALKVGRTGTTGCSNGYRVKSVPALRVGHGERPGPVLCWGRERGNRSRPTGQRLPDVVAISTSLRGTGRHRHGHRRGHRRLASTHPLAFDATLRPHVAAHRAVAIGGERRTKKSAPRRSGAVRDVGKEPRVENAAAEERPATRRGEVSWIGTCPGI